MLQTQGKYADALKHYSAALKGPDPAVRAKARYGIAESHYHRRDYEAALASYSKVIDDPKRPTALGISARFRLGRCLEKLDRTDEAAAQYRKIIEGGGADAKRAKELLAELQEK